MAARMGNYLASAFKLIDNDVSIGKVAYQMAGLELLQSHQITRCAPESTRRARYHFLIAQWHL